MANKKINQLDNRVGVALTDLSLVGDPTTGTSFKLTIQDISVLMGVPGKFNQPTGTIAQYVRGDGSLATFPSLTGFVPYTGATTNVDLGTHRILAQNATIASNGSGDTFTLNHSSGSGIGLNITKGGNGEGLYVNKTSGSGNAATIIGTLNATSLVKSGGTSSQFLKADGSVDSTTYIGGSGVTGQVAYWNGTNSQTGSNNLFWDAANSRLGIGTNAPAYKLHSVGNAFINGSIFFGDASHYIDTNNSTFCMISSNRNLQLARSGTASLTITSNFNTVLQAGGTITDTGQRLQVMGDAFIRGSGTDSATTALLVQNSAGTNLFRLLNNNLLHLGSTLSSYLAPGNRIASPSSSGTGFFFKDSAPNDSGRFVMITGDTYTLTSGSAVNFASVRGFSPTSSGATFINIEASGTINQTGGANGITRGLYVNPTLTAAADWRSIEWSNNSGWGLYGAGTADNYLGGDTYIGTTTTSATKLTIGGSETASSAIARGSLVNTTLVASANNDVLVGLDVNPTFTNGAFTGVRNIALRVTGFLQSTNFRTTASLNSGNDNCVFIGRQVGLNNSGANNIGIGGINDGVGRFTLQALTTGSNNNIIGQGSGGQITTGNGNIVLGTSCLAANSPTISTNIAIGNNSLNVNLGNSNISIGDSAALNVTSGGSNVFIGNQAGRRQADGSTNLALTGNNNIYIGQQVRGFNNTDTNAIVIGSVGIGLGSNTTVIGNSSTTDTAIYGRMLVNFTSPVIGTHALDVNGTARVSGNLTINTNGYAALFTTFRETGSDGSNIYIGGGGLSSTTGGGSTALGSYNTSVGAASLQSVTTGNFNSAFGLSTLNSLTTGVQNTAIGASASQLNTSGGFNTSVGTSALRNNLTGSYNVAIGNIAGRFISGGVTSLTVANNSIFIGTDSRALADSQTNQIVIGHQTTGAGSNTVTLGNTSITKTILRGTLNAANLPTSATGLSAGDIWNDGGTLKIV
jgi:hypothetical protein